MTTMFMTILGDTSLTFLVEAIMKQSAATVKTTINRPLIGDHLDYYQKVTPHHTHKITLDSKAPPCWTLFIPFRRSREWGFYTKEENGKVTWHEAEKHLKKLKAQNSPKTKSESEEEPDEEPEEEYSQLRTRSQTHMSKKVV